MVNDMVITLVPTSNHLNTMILGSGRFCQIFGWQFNGIAHADSHRGELERERTHIIYRKQNGDLVIQWAHDMIAEENRDIAYSNTQ